MLVGRASERRVIDRLLAAARAGSGGALVVTGEPGIGKTALLREAESLAGDMRVLRTAGSDTERDIPFAGLLQLLRPVLDLRERLPRPQAEALGQALSILPGRPAERFAVYAATLGLVCRAAEDRPLLVLVDDVHTMDRPSAEAVLFTARRLGSDSVAVLIGSRPPTEPGIAAGVPVLALAGLPPDAVRQLVADRALTEPQVARLVDVAAGNPLAALEISTRPDRLEEESLGSIPVPVLLAEAFEARLGQIDDDARAVLVIAAAGALELPELAATCVLLGLDPLALEEAERAGLVRRDQAHIAFSHPLVRAVAYQAADPGQRRATHRAIARALEGRDPDRQAWHLAEAATGPDADIADRLVRAAASAADRGAHAVASQHLERAARLTPLPRAAADRLVSAGEAAWLAGLTEHAVVLLDEAGRLPTEPDVQHRERALRGLMAARSGSLEESIGLLSSAASGLCEDAPEEAVLLLAEAVYAACYRCSPSRALGLVEWIDSMSGRLTRAGARGLASTAAGAALIFAGRGGDGVARLKEAVDCWNRSDTATDDPRWLPWRVLAPIWLRDAGSSRRLIDEVVAEARDRVALGALPFMLFHVARDHATTDRWATAEAGFLEAIRIAEETGHRTDEGASRAGLAWLLARQGREAETRAAVRTARAVCEAGDLTFGLAWLDFALGDLECSLGRPGAAVMYYLGLQEMLSQLEVLDPDLSPVPELVECWVRQGDDQRARPAAAMFHQAATDKGQPWALARAHRSLALAGADPEANFETATALHAETPDAYERARTGLAYGAWLRRQRRRTEARPVLGGALEVFDLLGAPPWSATAATELAATGARVRSRGSYSDRSLTPQELQVASLLGEGRTTRQAAAAVFLSPKTVEYHLRHVYQKLGISSRAELAARIADDPELRPRRTT